MAMNLLSGKLLEAWLFGERLIVGRRLRRRKTFKISSHLNEALSGVLPRLPI